MALGEVERFNQAGMVSLGNLADHLRRDGFLCVFVEVGVVGECADRKIDHVFGRRCAMERHWFFAIEGCGI